MTTTRKKRKKSVAEEHEQIDMQDPVFDEAMKARHVERYEWARRTVRERLGRRPMAVIDFASGTGYGSRILAQDALLVLGRDRHGPSIAKAQGRYADFPGMWFKVADEGRIGPHTPDDPQFDAFVCIETIEHLRDPNGLLERVLRLLRPGGVLALTTPAKSLGGKMTRFHRFEWTRVEAVDAVLRAGFCDILVDEDAPFGFTWLSARRPQ